MDRGSLGLSHRVPNFVCVDAPTGTWLQLREKSELAVRRKLWSRAVRLSASRDIFRLGQVLVLRIMARLPRNPLCGPTLIIALENDPHDPARRFRQRTLAAPVLSWCLAVLPPERFVERGLGFVAYGQCDVSDRTLMFP